MSTLYYNQPNKSIGSVGITRFEYISEQLIQSKTWFDLWFFGQLWHSGNAMWNQERQ